MSQNVTPPTETSTSRLPDVVRHEVTDARPRGLMIGPILGVVFALGAVAALGASILRSDSEPEPLAVEASDLTAQLVSLTIARLTDDGAPRRSTIAATVNASPNRDDYGWVSPRDTVVGQPAIRPSDSQGHATFSWSPGGEIEMGIWSSSVSVAEVVDASILDVAAECELDRDGVVSELGVAVALAPEASLDSGESVVRYTFLKSALRAGDRVSCTFVDVTVDVTVDDA